MSYLFLNFADNLDKDSKSKIDFYNLSLEKQYELLLKRIPSNRKIESFREFIEKCFPTAMLKKYYLSCPNFLREKRGGIDGSPLFLNNLVVRPELTLSMKSCLPDGQNIILIGDIYEGNKLKCLKVKGIQLIDDTMHSEKDIVVSLMACNSFSKANWSVTHVDYNDTYFTPNNISDIVSRCYTVSNPIAVRKSYELWNEYFNFRKYYLNEQSNRNFLLDSSEYLETYAINKKEYKLDSLLYDDYLLEGRNEFKQGDMVILDSKVGTAESFPLICLKIIRNKKEFNSCSYIKGNKMVNEEERKIRSLSSDNVLISKLNPTGVELNKLIANGYELGERFKILKYDIYPEEHILKVTNDYTKRIQDALKTIEVKYVKIIQKELEEVVLDYSNNIINSNKNKIDTYVNELEESLLLDIESDVDGLIKKAVEQVKKTIVKNKKESEEEFTLRLNEALGTINNKKLYIERNAKYIRDYSDKLNNEASILIEKFRISKQKELEIKYSEDVKNEQIEMKNNLTSELEEVKNRIITDETLICFALFFKPNDRKDVTKSIAEQIAQCKYICYDHRAETAKLKRQELALNNFYSGNVKNPYLSTYLFDSQFLENPVVNYGNFTWYLESLNDKQKEAVRKALSSNGIFLLQGPPGTGKTQVIAEVVAHLVKDGKKVLISSETHKAIDNVFERMPKIAEIVPIRLIPSKNSKESEYTPKFLVDNFYINISTNMKNIVEKYKNFKKKKEEFEEKFSLLKMLNSKFQKSQAVFDKAQLEIERLSNESKEKNVKIADYKDQIDVLKVSMDILKRTLRHVEKIDLRLSEDTRQDYIAKFYDKLLNLFDGEIYNLEDISLLCKNIHSIKDYEIEESIRTLNPESSVQILKVKIAEIKNEISKLCDEFDEPLEGNEEKVNALRTEGRKLAKQLKESGSNTNNDNLLLKIFNFNYANENINSLKNVIESKKKLINIIIDEMRDLISNDILEISNNIDSLQVKIKSINSEIKILNDKIEEIEDSTEIQEIQNTKHKLETQIDLFFKEFSILEPYKDIEDALEIISKTFKDLEANYEQREIENKEKIPMYERISNFLLQEDVIQQDRKLYTRSLFENANVFGITCTSNDRYTSENNSELGDFNLDDIDIKNLGIDVVIIDEVSKSSFIDLLIPMLYGKTVILVGDHRQLPPMYEFAKLRDEDFENLDESIINVDINRKFTRLYEECFFKTLFEKIPYAYKTMLVQQYRCHEHIMKVFNHFYQGELRIGFNGQNNFKKHGIDLYSNGRKIIQSDKHIYFVDCKQPETRDFDSTSIYNIGEASVIVELLKKLKYYFKNNPNITPLSVGIICTYGDQAKKIKELMKAEKVKPEDFNKTSEKFIVSTVDDFQGDERDIIILSTVRNPQEPSKSNPGFILAYQRINVALSRARRLLIVVGNRKYLEQRGVINLPDVYGRIGFDQKNFRVYEEIINTIETYGKVIDDIDVLELKEGKINA